LVFRVEQVFCAPTVNYSAVTELIKKEELTIGAVPPLLGIGDRLLALKKRMPRKAYSLLIAAAESAAAKAEAKALLEAPLLPGVKEGLEAARSSGWLVAAASDFGRTAVADSLAQKSLLAMVDLIAARGRLDEKKDLSRKLLPVKGKVKSLMNVVYFCNRSKEVKEAKSLGMRCIVLPSKAEAFRTLLWAEPDGMILSLVELPQLLALPSMKPPEQGGPVQKSEEAGVQGRADTSG
jgi:beta-phosphoglucomutase-like phosphatase (HAD superfamily)